MSLYDDALAMAHRDFVGRRSEIAAFESIVDGGEARIWWVFGPGGIGKTRLLSVLAASAERFGCAVRAVDFRAGEADGRASTEAVIAEVAEGVTVERALLVLDALEPSPSIERWLRTDVLPRLPSCTIVLAASRNPPGPEWRSDPMWSALLQLVPLRGLSRNDGRQLLTSVGVPADLVSEAVELGHGHPLALQLLAETLTNRPGEGVPETIRDAPDLVPALLGRLVGDAPDGQHRRAVEIASIARVTTRSMIRDIDGLERADQLFEWLASQPWVERLPGGLCPHDLAREVIEADLFHNDPDRYAAAKRAVRNHVLDPVRAKQDPDRCAADYIYLHRSTSMIRSAWDWSTLGHSEITGVEDDDRDALAELVAASYGHGCVPIVDYWQRRQPHGFAVLRDAGEMIGFVVGLEFAEPTADDLAADPTVAAIWQRALRRGGPRKGETIGVSRFVCDRKAGTLPPSPTYNVCTVLCTKRWLTGDGLCLDYLVKPRLGLYEPMMDYIDFHPVVDAEHRIGGVEMAVFEHDWREVPVGPWLDRMEELERGASFPPAVDDSPVLTALEESAFADAVRAALRELSRPDRLGGNPLTTSRVVRDIAGDDGPDALAQTLRQAFDELGDHRRTERARRAVERTYFHGAVTQEAAAEVLGMAFSTYRRHLTVGVDLLVDRLWRWELYGRTG